MKGRRQLTDNKGNFPTPSVVRPQLLASRPLKNIQLSLTLTLTLTLTRPQQLCRSIVVYFMDVATAAVVSVKTCFWIIHFFKYGPRC